MVVIVRKAVVGLRVAVPIILERDAFNVAQPDEIGAIAKFSGLASARSQFKGVG